MECELWRQLYKWVMQVGRERAATPHVRFSDALIVCVFFWACLHDRPVSWACVKRHWRTTSWKPLTLPSPSTLSRRLRTESVKQLLTAIEKNIRESCPCVAEKFLDGKPLPIGGCSKDREARFGRGSGGKARGYKLHVIYGFRPVPEAWTVRPMNDCEWVVARDLIPQLTGEGYLVADGAYDKNHLYDLALVHHHQLVAARSHPQAKGLGHQRHSLQRIRSLAMLNEPRGKELMNHRLAIERYFGNATAFAGGLTSLPPWVRTLARVTRWVAAKLLINAVRILVRKELTTSMQ
jgi:Transposase DDE domain